MTTQVEMDIAEVLEQVSLEASLFAVRGGSWSFGPVRINYNLEADGLRLAAYLFDQKVGEAKLTTTVNVVTFEKRIGPVKFEIKLEADFAHQKLVASGKVCVWTLVPGLPPKFEWKCRGFNTVIFSW